MKYEILYDKYMNMMIGVVITTKENKSEDLFVRVLIFKTSAYLI